MKAEKRRNIKTVKNVIVYIILLSGVFVTLFPVVWMVLTSFKSQVEITSVPMTFFPKKWVLEHYEKVLEKNIWPAYMNSIILAVSALVLQLATASMAAYAFARLEFRGKNVIFGALMAMLMIPAQMTLIPKYRIISAMGLVDTRLGVVLPAIATVMTTFFLRQSFLSFPQELEDAAKIDGCGNLRIFLRMILPLSRGSLTAMGVLILLNSWNSLQWPIVILNSEEKKTLSMFVASAKGVELTDYGFMMAACSCAVLPLIILYAFCQKSFVASMTTSGIKG